MPKAKKTMKLRDQKPMHDPKGGKGNAHLNSAGTESSKNQRRGHKGHGHF